MIFVINNLKYDTTKMELISIKCEYKYTGTMLNMTEHKLDEWREFCRWIETLPYSELITGGME